MAVSVVRIVEKGGFGRQLWWSDIGWSETESWWFERQKSGERLLYRSRLFKHRPLVRCEVEWCKTHDLIGWSIELSNKKSRAPTPR